MIRIPVPVFLAILIVTAFIGFLLVPVPPLEPKSPQIVSIVPNASAGFCLAGCPTGAPADDLIITHHIYELANNPRTKFADWVAYKISFETLGGGCKRIWKIDPDLPPDVTLSPVDYVGARDALASDRGHQAPLASLCGSPYWAEADYLSNITPQKSALNEGAWERLENAERGLIKDNAADAVYSITGPLYERPMPSLPRSRMDETTPSGYWKVISFQKGSDIYAAAFVMDQELAKDANYCDEELPLIQVEQRAHLKFFPQLSGPGDDMLHQSTVLHVLHC